MGFIRLGGENLKLVIIYGISCPLNENIYVKDLVYHFDAPNGFDGWGQPFFHFSIGVSYRIKGKSKSKYSY